MIFRASDRLYVDESKARGYYVVATASSTGSTPASEKALRALLKPGQRRIHFKSERDSRRREILSRMNELDVRVAVWIAKVVQTRKLATSASPISRPRPADLVSASSFSNETIPS